MKKQKPRRRAILITGLNSWGKSRLIAELFGKRTFRRLMQHKLKNLPHKFRVQSQSNADIWSRYKPQIVVKSQRPYDLLAAFSPSTDTQNEARDLLSKGGAFDAFDEIHLLLLEYKWDGLAKLQVEQIKQHLTGIPKLSYTVIKANDITERAAETERAIQAIYS